MTHTGAPEDSMDRRGFCKAAGLGLGGLVVGHVFSSRASAQVQGPLVPPAFATRSTEICFNSRASQHSGLTGTMSDQQLANILWATGRAPYVGSHRTIQIATATGTFTYDPATHALTRISDTVSSNAMSLTFDREHHFDAGVAYMPAFLASVCAWTGTESQLASCPQGSAINFGVRSVTGLKTDLVAVSSNGSLPNPTTNGANNLHDVLAALRLYDSFRSPANLTLQQLSQLLWGCYGCTPHTVNSSRQGLTVPSSWARYPLTDRIYVIQDKVWRYGNRQGGDLTTADHRLDLARDEDMRSQLRTTLPGLPTAPCYLVLCLPDTYISDWYSLLEVGFAAGATLIEATTMNLGCHFRFPLTATEVSGLRTITQMPSTDYAQAVIAIGQPPLTGVPATSKTGSVALAGATVAAGAYAWSRRQAD